MNTKKNKEIKGEVAEKSTFPCATVTANGLRVIQKHTKEVPPARKHKIVRFTWLEGLEV